MQPVEKIFCKFPITYSNSFHDLLDGTALRDIESTLDWLLEIQSKNGNFPPSVEEIGINRESNELLHWCHGATGAVHLMIVAYLSTKKAKFLVVFIVLFASCLFFLID